MTTANAPVSVMRDLVRIGLTRALGGSCSFEYEAGGVLVVFTPAGLRFRIKITGPGGSEDDAKGGQTNGE